MKRTAGRDAITVTSLPASSLLSSLSRLARTVVRADVTAGGGVGAGGAGRGGEPETMTSRLGMRVRTDGGGREKLASAGFVKERVQKNRVPCRRPTPNTHAHARTYIHTQTSSMSDPARTAIGFDSFRCRIQRVRSRRDSIPCVHHSSAPERLDGLLKGRPDGVTTPI